ncbi:MAG: coenzyme F420 hydrogenase [Chlorobiaceae bacterium]|nr:coenzyme F420 hydrogenase [Chlorobiaceae bacterium]
METPRKIAKPSFDEPLCSHCGLCMGNAWPEEESLRSCVFNTGWLGRHEERLFGRRRNPADEDELAFGICRSRFNARMKTPVEGAQWGGIITSIAVRALETGLVEGVVTLHGTMLHPKAALAKTRSEVLEGRGNKPVLSPTLMALHAAWRAGLKKLLVIGAPCHVHALRDFHASSPLLREMELHVVGIPCTDNLESAHLRWVLGHISKSPDTITSMEFMQDYRVHIKHTGKKIEKVPFFSLPADVQRPGVFSSSCMSCFDYANGLADITVGYFGAPFSKDWKTQWVIVRTEKGDRLFDLVREGIDTSPEEKGGNAVPSVEASMEATIRAVLDPESLAARKKLPKAAGNVLCLISALRGPKGIEFARYSIHIHALRNYCFVRRHTPEKFDTLVPEHVRELAKRYRIDRIFDSPEATEG